MTAAKWTVKVERASMKKKKNKGEIKKYKSN